MTSELYTKKNSDYLLLNHDWHLEDSPWKAKQILKMLKRNKLKPKTIVEMGCGAGEILSQLHTNLEDKMIEFFGYEIAPDAIELCKKRTKPRLNFYQENLLEKNAKFDLLLMIDVFEHVENYLEFIKKTNMLAEYFIYHIPLDISVVSVLRNRLIKTRRSVGHLHHFMKATAIQTLIDSNQEVLDFFYTAGSFHNNKKLRTRILNLPRALVYKINPDFAVRLFGGYSLLVLTQNKPVL
jgi:SAM-dependent methyltransferase